MLTTRYMTSVKNVPKIFAKIIEGTAPAKFTQAHLKSLGFTSSNDVSVLPILKDLGFLSPDGVPTKRYHDYRDKTRAKAVMAAALKSAYEDIFHINEKPTQADKQAIEGKFKSVHNATDRVASEQAKTFFALLALADLDAKDKSPAPKAEVEKHPSEGKSLPAPEKERPDFAAAFTGLRYNIEIHLPATKDTEVYNAIFKSLREHLLDD